MLRATPNVARPTAIFLSYLLANTNFLSSHVSRTQQNSPV
jgi:hypothetical protein